MSKDTKTPLAFPYNGAGDDLNYSKGMTLRDYFAAKAMQGLMQLSSPDGHEDAGLTAQWAYAYADAMLKARAT